MCSDACWDACEVNHCTVTWLDIDCTGAVSLRELGGQAGKRGKAAEVFPKVANTEELWQRTVFPSSFSWWVNGVLCGGLAFAQHLRSPCRAGSGHLPKELVTYK